MRFNSMNRGEAIGAVLATALLSAREAQAQTPPQLTVIRVASSPNDQVSPLLYGISAGLFRRAGLDVSITSMRNGAEVASAVVGGALEVGASDVVISIEAHSKGVPFTLVGPTVYYDVSNNNVGMLASGSSKITTARDLLGKTIGVNALYNSFALGTMRWIDLAGIDPLNAVKFVEIPIPAIAQALDQGRIDAGIAFEPFLSAAIGQGARLIGYPFENFGHRSEPSAYFSSQSWAAAHRVELQKFRDVLRTAAIYANAHPADTFPLLAKFTDLPPEVVAKTKPSVWAVSLEPALIQPYIDAAAKYKFIPQAFPARDLIS